MLFIRIAIFLSLPSFILPVRELKQPWRLYNITDDKRHVDNTSTVNDTKTEDDNDNNTGTDNDTSAGDNISTSDETSTSNDTVPTDNAAISVDTTTVTAEDTTPDIGTSNTTDTADDAITNIGASNTTLTIDDTITTTSSIETDEIYANDTVPDINKEIIKNFSMKLYPLENFTTPRNIRVRIENTDCSGDESAICGKEVTCKVNRMDGKNFKLPVTAYSSNSLILPHTTCSCEEGNAYGVEVYHEEKRDVYMKCYENNPCEQCDSQHTLQCIINDDNSATCVCETGYSEFENCKEVKNGCDKPHPAATLSGNEACLVNNSNVCQPKFDSYEYTCMCKEPYREDRRLSFPNCMINTTYCKSMICVGFQPPVSALIPGPVVYVNIDDYDVIEADDCRNTTCYCPDGWVGQHCTEPRGDIVQLSWSPWSACNPDCIMPNRRWNYKYGEEIHAGESRTTGLGYMSKYARCNHNDSRYCQGTYRMWKRCTVTNLCDIETESRISTVIAKAIGKAMEKHDEAHDEAVSPLITEAVELTWEEQHHINLLGIIVCLILVIIAITALEIHHMVIYWNKVE